MKPHLVNVHIPKSAGTALRANLAEILPTTKHSDKKSIISVDPIPDMPYHDGLRKDFAARFPKLFDQDCRMISGHVIFRNVVDVISPSRERVSVITFLRDPIWRTISDYYYCISAAHIQMAAFVSNYPTFEHYMSNPGEMNKMTDFLCLEPEASAQDKLRDILRAFDFIGITENFSHDLAFIAHSLGRAPNTEIKANINLNKGEMHRAYEKYSPILRSVLHEDFALYHGVLKHRGLA